MPFGEEINNLGGRSASVGYNADNLRQKFTGYQRDNETNLDFAEARYYNSQNGRFTAVDPLLASGKSANPQTFNRYAYTMNRPLIYIDINGKFPITIFVRAFAPFDWFGPGNIARGDGNNRPFSTNSDVGSRISAVTNYETTGRNESSSRAYGSLSETQIGPCPICYTVKAYSDAYFIDEHSNSPRQMSTIGNANLERNTGIGQVEYHLAGKDRAINLGHPSLSITPDIDIHTNLRIQTTQIGDGTGNLQLNIRGGIQGDRFPAAETFVADSANNRLFLGVFAPSSFSGPAINLPGDRQWSMININVTVLTNSKGVFLGVMQNGKQISIEEWNKQFSQQATVNR
jgi:RHS repeat-associated protein